MWPIVFGPVLVACTLVPTDSDELDLFGDRTLTSGGVQRSYSLHVPSSLDRSEPVPLVLALHGVGQSGDDLRRLSELDTQANRHGFIVAYPYAFPAVLPTWTVRGAAPVDGTVVDDASFVSDLIDVLMTEYNIDPARVYAAGLSNGALMTQRLACDLAERITAIASVAATMYRDVAASCAPGRPVPAMFFLGTLDMQFPWDGLRFPDGTSLLPIEAALTRWSEINGCSPIPDVTAVPDTADDGMTVERREYVNCSNDSQLVFYAVLGGGHAWPGGNSQSTSMTRDIVASELVAEFFLSHRK